MTHSLDANIPIFLLHGAGGNSWSLYPIQFYLYFLGFQNVNIISYTTNQDFETTLNDVDQKLEKITNKSEDNPIVVIGQSNGGVMGVHLHTKGWKVELLIAIASPIRGAKFVSQLKATIPTLYYGIAHRPLFDHYEAQCDKSFEPPPHKCISISTAYPFTDFDGCVYKHETIIHKDSHHHVNWSDHRLVFASPRLLSKLGELISVKENRSETLQ